MKKNNTFLKVYLLYFLISIVLTVYIIGFQNLSPNSLNWLLSNDRLGELIGWLNFRNSEWSFPFGVYEQGELGPNSVVFNGTVPLFAIIFKLLFKNFENFQYFSFWISLCIFLQGLISFLLIKKLTNKTYYSIIGSFFFILSPIFIHRIGIHISLSGHWILLLYFLNYLYFNKNYHLNNILIIVLSAGIHFYFTAILFLIDFILYFYWFFLKKKKSFFLKNLFLKIFCIAFFMYFLGYFTLSPQDVLGGGFGTFKMNMLAFIDPGVNTMDKQVIWSTFLPDIPNNYGEHEGFNYFGVGFISIFIVSLIYFLKNFEIKNQKNFFIFLFSILIFFFISVSNNIGLANNNILSISLNKFILAPLSLIRASGRFIWIVNYFLLIFSLIIIFKNFSKYSNFIISIVFLIQLIDISSGLKTYYGKDYFKSDIKISNNEIWNKIDENFTSISSTYLVNPSPEFYSLSGLIINSKIKSELIVSARYDREKFANLRYSNLSKIYHKKLDNKVFVISGLSHLHFIKNYYNDDDNFKIYKLNNHWFLQASKNLPFEKKLMAGHDEQIDSKKVILNKDYILDFKKSFNEVSFLGLGWTSYKGSSSPWTDGAYSSLIFDISQLKNIEKDYFLDINLENKFLNDDEYIDLEVETNEYPEKQKFKFNFEDKKKKIISIKFRRKNAQNDMLIVHFKTKGIIKTDFENLIGIDQRKIGLRIDNIKFRE